MSTVFATSLHRGGQERAHKLAGAQLHRLTNYAEPRRSRAPGHSRTIIRALRHRHWVSDANGKGRDSGKENPRVSGEGRPARPAKTRAGTDTRTNAAARRTLARRFLPSPDCCRRFHGTSAGRAVALSCSIMRAE